VTTYFDQEEFIKMNRKSALSGFNIDQHGNIQGIVNMISLLKVADPQLTLAHLQTQMEEHDQDDLENLFEPEYKDLIS
jgi:hypothetical protein